VRHARPLAALSAALVLAAGALTLTVAGPATAAGVDDIRINEIESTPTGQGTDVRDWVELVNTGTATVDISGLKLRGAENAVGAALAVPSGVQLAAGAYYAIDTDVDAAGGFRIGDADTVRLLTVDGQSQLDSYTWTTPAATTYGRCPNGTGAFAATSAITKGTANPCGQTGPTTAPSPTATVTVTPPPATVTLPTSGLTPATVRQDTTPPVVKIMGLKNDGFYPKDPPKPVCMAKDDSGLPTQCALSVSFSVKSALVAIKVALRAVDAAGNVATASKTFTVPAAPTKRG
jgi:hypothetical protein